MGGTCGMSWVYWVVATGKFDNKDIFNLKV